MKHDPLPEPPAAGLTTDAGGFLIDQFGIHTSKPSIIKKLKKLRVSTVSYG
jgi:hypothetical protein